ncbi:MAG: DUF4837 family protein [Bacteroidales bacterium]|nr:DUF4837 family protein [Bacteroidales bacterium]
MKKTIFTSLFTVVFIIIFLSSCNYEKPAAPNSTGKTSEMLVITNNKAQWNSQLGDTIKDFFGQLCVGLPQPEPLFSMVNIPEEAFIDMYHKHRNIFIVDIDKKLKKAQVETKKNLWAIPQRVIKITAPDKDSFYKIFNENKNVFLELFNRVERRRINNAYRSIAVSKISGKLNKDFGITLTVPGGFKIAKSTPDFVWLRRETKKESQGIMVYSYDYKDESSFELKNIIAKRNSITKKFIPGPTRDSYMCVSEEVIFPEAKEINFLKNYAVEVRGLWKVEGDFMGGPFLSYTFVNENTNKIITIDTYVYAPRTIKRDLLRQLEAICYTMKFVDNE